MTQLDAAANEVVTAFAAAQEAARANLGAGKVFLGAFGIAESLGYVRGTLGWDSAVSGAYHVFKHEKIVTDHNNVQI